MNRRLGPRLAKALSASPVKPPSKGAQHLHPARGCRVPDDRRPGRSARLQRLRRPATGGPVWFLINDGKLVFNTMRDSAKGRARARDPRVACAWTTGIRRFRLCRCRGWPRQPRIDQGQAGWDGQYRTARAEEATQQRPSWSGLSPWCVSPTPIASWRRSSQRRNRRYPTGGGHPRRSPRTPDTRGR